MTNSTYGSIELDKDIGLGLDGLLKVSGGQDEDVGGGFADNLVKTYEIMTGADSEDVPVCSLTKETKEAISLDWV